MTIAIDWDVKQQNKQTKALSLIMGYPLLSTGSTLEDPPDMT